MEARLLNTERAAAYLGLPPRAFKCQVKKGVLPTPIKLGPHDVWAKEDLDRCIDILRGVEPKGSWKDAVENF